MSVVLPRSKWIPDSGAEGCMKCSNMFSCSFRRHHCRYCGHVLCYRCSDRQIGAQRACTDCWNKDSQAQQRASILMASPNLRKVKTLSTYVQTKSKRETKQSRPQGPLSQTDSPSVVHSPRIARSIKNLENLYGSPTMSQESKRPSQVVVPERSGASPPSILSPTLHKVEKKRLASRPPVSAEGKVMIVVDPFSTGAVLAAELLVRGAKVVRLLSAEFPAHILNLVLEGTKIEFIATVQHKGDLDETVAAIKELKLDNLVGCIPGCETGVELADAVSEALDLRTNGTKYSDTRRNKYYMGEQVRKAGLRAVKQARARTMGEVNQFLKGFSSVGFKVVIKPVAAAGSDGVYVCRSHQEVQDKFKVIMGVKNVLGAENSEVVIQEFLEGKEYVVDTVSRDRKHKVVAVWEYDKRPTNGAPFVYFGLRLMSGDDKKVQELMAYQVKVLDALGIVNGAGHGEVMYTPTGPCLVEVGARAHGGEGSFMALANACLGYNQVKVIADVYLDLEAFYQTPDIPILKDWFGVQIYLVSYVEGILKDLPRLEDVKKLPSYFKSFIFAKIGEKISKTIDVITVPGTVHLLHQDKIQLEADFLRIHAWEELDFYLVEPEKGGRDGKRT